MRKIVPIGLVLLSGCPGNMNQPPSTPTTTQIAAQEQSLLASGIPPTVYVAIGTTLATAEQKAS